MITRHSQRGMSSIGWLFTVAGVGFVLTSFFKLGPAYLDNVYVRNGLQSLEELRDSRYGLSGIDNREIRNHLNNYFQINNVRGVATDNVDIDRRSDRVLVNIDYEKRVPMLFNVDVVMTFENQFDGRRPEACCTPRE